MKTSPWLRDGHLAANLAQGDDVEAARERDEAVAYDGLFAVKRAGDAVYSQRAGLVRLYAETILGAPDVDTGSGLNVRAGIVNGHFAGVFEAAFEACHAHVNGARLEALDDAVSIDGGDGRVSGQELDALIGGVGRAEGYGQGVGGVQLQANLLLVQLDGLQFDGIADVDVAGVLEVAILGLTDDHGHAYSLSCYNGGGVRQSLHSGERGVGGGPRYLLIQRFGGQDACRQRVLLAYGQGDGVLIDGHCSDVDWVEHLDDAVCRDAIGRGDDQAGDARCGSGLDLDRKATVGGDRHEARCGGCDRDDRPLQRVDVVSIGWGSHGLNIQLAIDLHGDRVRGDGEIEACDGVIDFHQEGVCLHACALAGRYRDAGRSDGFGGDDALQSYGLHFGHGAVRGRVKHFLQCFVGGGVGEDGGGECLCRSDTHRRVARHSAEAHAVNGVVDLELDGVFGRAITDDNPSIVVGAGCGGSDHAPCAVSGRLGDKSGSGVCAPRKGFARSGDGGFDRVLLSVDQLDRLVTVQLHRGLRPGFAGEQGHRACDGQ